MEKQIPLGEIAREAARTERNSIYVRMPGSVVAYYPNDTPTPTADVQPMVSDPRVDLDTGAIVYEPWSVIQRVPVAWPRMGGFLIMGFLSAQDPVILEAFDLDPTAWRAQGRSSAQVNPGDARRLGGNYWLCRPEDLCGPITDQAAAAAALIIGKDGDPAQIRISAGKIQLGNAGGDSVALASKCATEFSNIQTAITNLSTTGHGSYTPATGGVGSSLIKAQ